jgi:hypothetical protein
MGFIKFLLWTSFCVGLGIFIASYEAGGATPLDHVKRIAHLDGKEPKLDELKASLKSSVQQARSALGTEKRPTENHSAEDRAAVNKLIANRAGQR